VVGELLVEPLETPGALTRYEPQSELDGQHPVQVSFSSFQEITVDDFVIPGRISDQGKKKKNRTRRACSLTKRLRGNFNLPETGRMQVLVPEQIPAAELQ
jgi:hypothetical protein